MVRERSSLDVNLRFHLLHVCNLLTEKEPSKISKISKNAKMA